MNSLPFSTNCAIKTIWFDYLWKKTTLYVYLFERIIDTNSGSSQYHHSDDRQPPVTHWQRIEMGWMGAAMTFRIPQYEKPNSRDAQTGVRFCENSEFRTPWISDKQIHWSMINPLEMKSKNWKNLWWPLEFFSIGFCQKTMNLIVQKSMESRIWDLGFSQDPSPVWCQYHKFCLHICGIRNAIAVYLIPHQN